MTNSAILSVPSSEVLIEAGEKVEVPLTITKAKGCKLNEEVTFSNGQNCIIRGTIVSEGVELFNSNGEQLTSYDLGQVYMG